MQKWTEIMDIQKWVEMALVIIGTVVCGNVLKKMIAFGSLGEKRSKILDISICMN